MIGTNYIYYMIFHRNFYLNQINKTLGDDNTNGTRKHNKVVRLG